MTFNGGDAVESTSGLYSRSRAAILGAATAGLDHGETLAQPLAEVTEVRAGNSRLPIDAALDGLVGQRDSNLFQVSTIYGKELKATVRNGISNVPHKIAEVLGFVCPQDDRPLRPRREDSVPPAGPVPLFGNPPFACGNIRRPRRALTSAVTT